MNKSGLIKILVTGGGALLGQSIIRSIEKSKYKSKIFVGVADPDPLSVGLFWADRPHKIPLAKDPDFIPKVYKLIKDNQYVLLIPGTDAELEKLSQHKDYIQKKFNCIVLVSSPKVINISNDKYETYKFLRKNKYNPPNSCIPEKLEEFINKNKPPYIVKPREGARSLGVYKINEYQELKKIIKKSSNPIIQEYISNKRFEYTAGSLVFNKKCFGTIIMRRDLKDGNTYRAWTERSQKLEKFVADVSERLNPFGPCNFQFRLDDKLEPRIFEINARFSGTTFFRTKSGFPEVEMVIKYLIFKKDISKDVKVIDIGFLRYWDEIELESNTKKIL